MLATAWIVWFPTPLTNSPSAVRPSWPDTINQSPARTTGVYGPTGGTIGGSGDQLNEDPQPQVREALGFEMWKPAPWSPSL